MKVKGTITYGDLAKKCGTAPRAVGQIMNKNPFAPFVPCHRVVAKNGIGGFASGTEVKKKLLELDAKK
ncbi:MAG: MGMT family protein [Candidatus Altiarchaeota archaeon]|nr:MGMT family protein [Candidatus Altiarchaeota archaeon]